MTNEETGERLQNIGLLAVYSLSVNNCMASLYACNIREKRKLVIVKTQQCSASVFQFIAKALAQFAGQFIKSLVS